jgi:hypothetical protein
MPYFDYEGDIDIDVDDFLSACSSREIKELITALVEDGHLPQSVLNGENSGKQSIMEWEFNKIIEKITSNYIRLTSEEEEMLRKIASRF